MKYDLFIKEFFNEPPCETEMFLFLGGFFNDISHPVGSQKTKKIAEQRQPVKTPGRWRLLCWPPLGRELFINYEPITAGLKTTNIDDNKPIQKLC